MLRRNPTTGTYGCFLRAVSAVPMSCRRSVPASGEPYHRTVVARSHTFTTLRPLSRPRSQVRSGANWNVCPCGIARFLMESKPRVEPKFPLLVVGISGTFSGGGDVMVRQIEELLLLTCLGGHRGHHVRRNPAPLTKQKQGGGMPARILPTIASDKSFSTYEHGKNKR